MIIDPNEMYSAEQLLLAPILFRRFRLRTYRSRPGASVRSLPLRALTFQLTINTQGRLITPEQFGQIIVKRGDNGEIVYLADVGRTELGAKDCRRPYLFTSMVDQLKRWRSFNCLAPML